MANKLFSFHGGGGSGGSGGYGSGADHPRGSWFQTLAPTGLSDQPYSSIRSYIAPLVAVGDNCIVCGFLWHVPKGKDGPADQELLTSPVNEVSKRTRPRGARK